MPAPSPALRLVAPDRTTPARRRLVASRAAARRAIRLLGLSPPLCQAAPCCARWRQCALRDPPPTHGRPGQFVADRCPSYTPVAVWPHPPSTPPHPLRLPTHPLRAVARAPISVMNSVHYAPDVRSVPAIAWGCLLNRRQPACASSYPPSGFASLRPPTQKSYTL